MPQKTIDGRWEPIETITVTEALRRMPSDMPSGEKQRNYLAHCEAVRTLILNILQEVKTTAIEEVDMLESRIRTLVTTFLLEEMPSPETIARASRPSANARPQVFTRNGPPQSLEYRWYDLYLKSAHMQQLRKAAREYYASCVLCGDVENPHIHHRHYRSLGQEQLADVSVLCSGHHKDVHPLLGIKIPPRIPSVVAELLRLEGIL